MTSFGSTPEFQNTFLEQRLLKTIGKQVKEPPKIIR
jgi:hypothetical protein